MFLKSALGIGGASSCVVFWNVADLLVMVHLKAAASGRSTLFVGGLGQYNVGGKASANAKRVDRFADFKASCQMRGFAQKSCVIVLPSRA